MLRIFEKKVIDFVIPIGEFTKIHYDASIFEAVTLLENIRSTNEITKTKCRPLLVVDDNDRIIGKVGPICCLKALKPDFCVDFDDIEKIIRLEEFHSDFLESLLCKNIFDLFRKEYTKKMNPELKIINIMYAIPDSIESTATVIAALKKLITLNTLSILVKANSTVMGLVHLFDLYNEMASFIMKCER